MTQESKQVRRRRWPWVVGFTLLGLFALLALAPMLFSGMVGGVVTDKFASERAGRLEIGALELAWTSRQRVDNVLLLAPDGGEVARVSVELPSLLDLARSGGARVGKVTVTAEAALVADDDGVTNLDRALALRSDVQVPEPTPSEPGEPTDLGKLLRELELEVEVQVAKAQWSDARTRAAGRPFAVENLVALMRAKPGEPLRVDVNGTLVSEQPGSIKLVAALHDLFSGAALNDQARFELDAKLDALPSAFIDALAQQPGTLATLFGPQFTVTAQGEGTLASGKLGLRVEGPRGAVVFDGALVDGVLGRDTPASLQVALRPEPAGFERLLAAYAPEGLALTALDEPRIELGVTNLRVALQSILDAQASGGVVVDAAIAGSEFELRVATQGWKASGALLPFKEGVTADKLRLDVALKPENGPRTLTLQLETELGAGASGFANAQVRIEDLARFLGGNPALLIQAAKGDEPRFDVTLTLQQLQSRTLSAFVPPEFDARELLGAALDLRVDVTNGKGRREAIVRVNSPTLAVDMTAWMDGGVVVQPSSEPWTIRFTPPAGALSRAAKKFVPEGMTLELGKSVVVSVGPGLRVPLEELAAAKEPVATLLQKTEADARVEVDAVDFADPTRSVALRSMALALHLGHEAGKPPLTASFEAKLGADRSGSLSLSASCPKPGALDTIVDPLTLPELTLALKGQRLPLALVDGAAGPESLSGKLGTLADFALDARVTQGADERMVATLELDSKFEKAALGASITAKVEDLFARKARRAEGVPPPLEAQVKARGLAAIRPFLPADVGASVAELLGDTLDVELSARPMASAKSAGDSQVAAKISAARLSLSTSLEVTSERIRISQAPFELVVRPTQGMLDRHAGPSLPAGTTVALLGDEERLAVRVEELDVVMPKDNVGAKELLADARLRARVELPRLRSTQSGGVEPVVFEMQSCALDASLAPKSPAKVALALRLAGATPASVDASVEVAALAPFLDPIDASTIVPPRTEAKFTVGGLRAFTAFVPAEFRETLFELAGDSVRAELALEPSSSRRGGEGSLAMRVDMRGVQVQGAASLSGGRVEIGAKPLELSVRLSNELLQRHVGASLPVGASVAFTVAEPVFGAKIESLSLPLDPWMPAAGSEPASLASALRRAGLKLGLTVPSIRYTHPAAVEGQAGTPVDLRDLALAVALESAKPAVVSIDGKLGGEKAGTIALRASIDDCGAFVERGEGAPLPPVRVDGTLEGLPTALVDALAAQDGLLVDVLGPIVRAKVEGVYPSKTDPLRAELASANAKVRVVARLEETLVVSVGDEGIDASLPLSPLFSKRIIGNLVPLFVNASKPEGSKPLALKLSKFQLPLDGDLRKLNGDVTLDLGEVTYELLPSLTRVFDAFGEADLVRKTTNLKSLSIPIRNGVAGYEALPVSIRGVEYPFVGTYDIAKGEMKLAASLPLSLLGKSVTRELDKVRDFVDPNLLVPIEISGKWSSPSFRLGKGFVDKLLRDALGGDLIDGLNDLFGKKKDKKD